MSQDSNPDQNEAPVTEASDQGTDAAAHKNRETQTRQQIVIALQGLGGEFSIEWPDFVREFCRDPREQSVFKDCAIPPPFQPPLLPVSPQAAIRPTSPNAAQVRIIGTSQS